MCVSCRKATFFNFQRHGTTSKPTKPITLDAEDQQKIAKVGLEMKLLTDEVEAEAENWDKYAENDIVKRAKVISFLILMHSLIFI